MITLVLVYKTWLKATLDYYSPPITPAPSKGADCDLMLLSVLLRCKDSSCGGSLKNDKCVA